MNQALQWSDSVVNLPERALQWIGDEEGARPACSASSAHRVKGYADGTHYCIDCAAPLRTNGGDR